MDLYRVYLVLLVFFHRFRLLHVMLPSFFPPNLPSFRVFFSIDVASCRARRGNQVESIVDKRRVRVWRSVGHSRYRPSAIGLSRGPQANTPRRLFNSKVSQIERRVLYFRCRSRNNRVLFFFCNKNKTKQTKHAFH